MQREDWVKGAKAIAPVCLSYIPMGLACGVLLQQAGYTSLAVFLMSLAIYGGAAQFMIASMTVSGAGVLEMATMVFFINLRHLLMSSSLADKIKDRSIPFSAFFAHIITDESFAINTMQFRNDPEWTSNKGLAASVMAYLTWGFSTFLGAIFSNSLTIPTTVMNFILTAMFVYLLVTQVEDKLLLVTAIVSIILAVLLMILLQNSLAVILASVIASGFGAYVQERRKMREGVQHE